MMRSANLLSCVAIATLLVHQPGSAFGQQRDRGGFIRDLLKTYVESQIQSQPAPSNPPAASRTSSPDPQIRRAGELLGAASSEMAELVDALLGDVNRANGVRQLLSLAFRVNADAAVLSRQLSYTQDIDALRPSLRQLDQDWRTLEYRLSQTHNLSATTLGHVERIKQYADQLNAMFQVPTQVDLNELSQRASQMHQALRTLLQDIRYEIPDRQMADRLFSAGRNTYEQLQRFVQLTRPYSNTNVHYETLKQEYERLDNYWTTYQQRLRQANNRHLQRQIQRINDDMRAMNSALYIEVDQISREELEHATSILRGDIDRLLRRINLKMLTQLPAARRYAIEAASDLDQTCTDFSEMLNDDVDNIRDMFLYMYDEWQRLNMSLQGVGSQEARQAIRDVETSLTDLQALLGVRFELDRTAAINLATTLNGHARHLQGDVRDVFGRPNRYPQDFQNNCLDEAARFEAATRSLYNALDRGEKLQTLAETMRGLAQSWTSLTRMLPQFSASDRGHLTQIEREITPQVVQLQTLLTP